MRFFRPLFVPALLAALLCACGREVVDTSHPLFVKAVQLREGGQAQEALKAFQDYVKINPSSVKTHFQLASLHHDRGEHVEAIYHYRQCLALDPGSADNGNIAKWVDAAERDLAAALLEKHPEAAPNMVDEAKAKAQAAELHDLREERAKLLQLVRKLKAAAAVPPPAPVSVVAAADSPRPQDKASEAKPVSAPPPAAAVVAEAKPPVQPAAVVAAAKPPAPPKAVVFEDPADRPAEPPDSPAAVVQEAPEPSDAKPVPATTTVAKATETPAPAAVPAQKAKPAGKTYTVQAGDNLFIISKKVYGVGKHHQLIYEANRGVLSSPTRLKIGQTLAIPPLPGKTVRPEPILDNL